MGAKADSLSVEADERQVRRQLPPPRDGFAAFLWRQRGLLLMVADFLAIIAVFVGVFYLRFRYQFMAIKYAYSEDVALYLKGAAILAATWVLFIWQTDGYRTDMHAITSPQERFRRLLIAGFKALVLLMVLSYLYRGLLLSRQVYLMSGVFALGMLALLRFVMTQLEQQMVRRGFVQHRVLVVGADDQTREFERSIVESRSPITIVGFLTISSEAGAASQTHGPVLGTIDEIERVYERERFDKIAMSQDVLTRFGADTSGQRLIGIVNFCEAHGIALYTLPNVISVAIREDEVGAFAGIPLVRIRDAALHPAYAVLKRVLDIAIALLVLVAGLPFWLVIGIIIKCTSKGPVLFTQQRIGLHGRPFKIYKFRSMCHDAEARLKDLVAIDTLAVPGFKIKGDPRVTKVGAFLRRTSLDEIPQILNVLKGEMSCVGPRPELPELVERYTPSQRRRLKAKPGITGWGQVMARGVPLAAAVDYDLYYLKHQSFLLDAYILFKTVIVVIRGSGITH